MKSGFCEGRLIKWNDERGFGFIQPIDGSQEVFLHISALDRGIRRPQVGDMIWYDRVTEANGKIRATKASIQGLETISPSPQDKSPRQSQQDKTSNVTKSTSPQRQRRKGGWNSWINPLRDFNPLVVMIPLIAVGVIGSVMRGNFTLPFFTKKYAAPVSTTSSPASIPAIAPISPTEGSPVPIAPPVESASPPAPIASTPIATPKPEATSVPVASAAGSGCMVKGNISFDDGLKLYHVPGMRDYEITIINESKGERWFCSEADAIANGWLRAPK
jgi:cold shock CspA family protein